MLSYINVRGWIRLCSFSPQGGESKTLLGKVLVLDRSRDGCLPVRTQVPRCCWGASLGLHFPAPLAFGRHLMSCYWNVGGSDTCRFGLTWLSIRFIIPTPFPHLPAEWHQASLLIAKGGKVIWWKQLGSLSHPLEESCPILEGLWGLGVVCAALSITSLEGGALAENRPECGALTGPTLGIGGDGHFWRSGEGEGPAVYSHCGQEFPDSSHPSEVTWGHWANRKNRNPMFQRGVVWSEETFLYLVESDGLFSIFISVLI